MKTILFIFALLLASGGVALAETPYFSTSVSSITDTSAKLNGGINGNTNWNGTVIGPWHYFEYGTTNSVNSNTPLSSTLVDGHLVVTLEDLEPDTTYYYRFVEKIGDTQTIDEIGYTYSRSAIKSFKTLDEDEDGNHEDTGLTDEQIEGLEDLGFTQTQIDKIVRLFEKKDGPSGLACGYRHHITLRHGMSGEDIKEMQKALKLSADGKFGRLTAEAVKRFQAEHGLPADGVIGPKTGLKLGLLCHAE